MSVTHQANQWKWYADEFEIGASRPKGIAFKADPLALVLSLKDQNRANFDIAHDLPKMSEIFATKDYMHCALKIRKYYRNRLVMQALKGIEMSKFRKDLRELVESDNVYYLREDFIPMIIKLPDFYEEDTMFDSFKKSFKTTENAYYRKGFINHNISLFPIKQHRRKTRQGDAINYYFTDEVKHLYKLYLDPRNPCLHLFDREFKKDQINFTCSFSGNKIRGTDMNMFYINEWVINE